MRTILPILVLALLVASWFVLSTGDGGRDEGAALERAVEGDGAERDLVTLRGREGAAVADATVTVPGPATTTPAEETPVETGLVVLRGELRGLDAVRPAEARVRVFPVTGTWANLDAEPAACVAGPDGRFTLDLAALFARSGDLTHVEIVVDHPACVQERVRLDVTAARALGRGELEATITLRPGLAITGEVVDEDGAPVLGADVALFALGKDGPTFEHILPVQPLTQEATDDAGRYRLRVAGPGRYLVVAATKTCEPAGRNVLLAAGAELEFAPLVLTPGVVISGRVLYDGVGVPQGYIEADPVGEEEGLPLQVGGPQVHWSPGPVLRSGGSAMTDDDGAFSVEGLSPGSHRIGLFGLSLPGVDDVSPDLSQRFGWTLDAPVADAVVEIAGAVLELRTTCAGQAVGGVGLQVGSSGFNSMWETDEHGGVLRVLVPSAVDLTVQVVEEGYEPATLTVSSGAAGSTEVRELRLVEAAPRPTLLVTFEGPRAEDLEQAWIRALRSEAAAPTDSEVTPPVPAPPALEAEKVGPGTFRVKGLAPGRRTLVVRPGTGFWEDAGYHLEIRKDVVVPAEGELAVRLTLRTGGRLRIAARDAAGVLLEADCVIRDAAGEEQAVTFSTHSEHVAMSQDGSLGTLSPSTVSPPLPVGAYRIELSLQGYEPRTVPVVVKAGETTDVDVRLTLR